MKKSSSKPLLSRLRAVANPPDVIPSKFKTEHQWAKEWGLQRLATARLLRAGVGAGLMERKNFRVVLSDGRTYPQPHYAEK
jgi:hypothetical protein